MTTCCVGSLIGSGEGVGGRAGTKGREGRGGERLCNCCDTVGGGANGGGGDRGAGTNERLGEDRFKEAVVFGSETASCSGASISTPTSTSLTFATPSSSSSTFSFSSAF